MSQQGVRIVARNFRSRFGEIDLIGYDGPYLVFFEIKYRKTSLAGRPEQAVNYRKRQTISKVADYYRMKNRIGDFTPMRFDVVSICGTKFRWYKNAFDYIC